VWRSATTTEGIGAAYLLRRVTSIITTRTKFSVATGWLRHEQDNIIAFLREENCVLNARLEGRRLRLDDSERRGLAELGQRLGVGCSGRSRPS
jgi:hypothetical protein